MRTCTYSIQILQRISIVTHHKVSLCSNEINLACIQNHNITVVTARLFAVAGSILVVELAYWRQTSDLLDCRREWLCVSGRVLCIVRTVCGISLASGVLSNLEHLGSALHTSGNELRSVGCAISLNLRILSIPWEILECDRELCLLVIICIVECPIALLAPVAFISVVTIYCGHESSFEAVVALVESVVNTLCRTEVALHALHTQSV